LIYITRNIPLIYISTFFESYPTYKENIVKSVRDEIIDGSIGQKISKYLKKKTGKFWNIYSKN
jgi:hypothetical protein